MRLETIAIQAGRNPDAQTGAVMPPIHLSTTFIRGNEDELVYSRVGNPNRNALESLLAQLEGGAAAIAFASGMAAVAGVFQALATGDHVILPDDTYFGVRELVTKQMVRWGLTYSMVDMTDLAAVKAAIQPNTRLVWIETPSNPMLKISDIATLADIAHEAGARVGVDGTWATPLLQQSLALGADYVVHSTTKYLGGHSDLLGGVVVAKAMDEQYELIRAVQGIGGGVPSGFDCWLLLRGIRTLPYRMRAHCANATKVAQFLADHPGVHTVHYPGLDSHPGHDVARKQMSDFGGMLSVQVNGGEEKAAHVARSTKIFAQATSLGGVESLIEHRALVEDEKSKTPRDLLRVSVGLEHPDDLIEDLAQALR
ncbi:MAG: aminotransferase class I/II-fold pyridoxal phosphate-dependent enzyme [Anaerolineales bacterium]|nr:aminotransferase class I/II-fold pyridoxal phosphate-dependent enzyme [Anaerolineales bacterium]MCB0008264.1 aminotransferase class I/II-fold pyridoxal phosphate-dependent enzyme [Anaerolineales bacterium]MCB8961956.1 aminotransferase class I/II-fold pyridoxal phosphate-dependent enzyme [Ardenticatenales bacterium]